MRKKHGAKREREQRTRVRAVRPEAQAARDPRPQSPHARETIERDPPAGELGTVSEAELREELPSELVGSGEASPDSRSPLTGEHEPTPNELHQAASSASSELAAEPIATTDPDQIVGLVELVKGFAAEVYGSKVGASREAVLAASKIPEGTRRMLRQFAPSMAHYLPALNANAPLVGAVAFVGLVALDFMATRRALDAFATKPDPANPPGKSSASRVVPSSPFDGNEPTP